MKNIEIAFKLAETIAKAYLPGIVVEFLPDLVFTTTEGKKLESGAIKVSAPWTTDALYLVANEPRCIRAHHADSWVTFLEMGGKGEGEFHRDVLLEDAILFALTTPIAWEIQAGIGSLNFDNGLFVENELFSDFLELRAPNSIFDQKVKEWYSSGDFSEHDSVDGIVTEACRSLDKMCVNEALSEVLFRGEDGKLYTLEAVLEVVEVSPERAEEEYYHLLEEGEE